MAVSRERVRKLVPGLVAALVLVSLYVVAQSRVATYGADSVAAQYKFKELPIAMPAGYNDQEMKTIRPVNRAYKKIAAWISSVGASIAINDLMGNGRADGMCIVDTRTNDVVVTYTPTAPATDRFTPFVLDASPLPMDDAMAPTVCTPGDFNGDSRMDLLVSYWGRTPILFLAKANATTLSNAAYRPQELLPSESLDGRYHGPRWNTDAAYVGDLDGDSHPDIIIGNYFPESDVLDPHAQNNVEMNDSLSTAKNGAGDRVLRWHSATSGDKPSTHYIEQRGAIPYQLSTGWTLAIAGADLTGSGLPDIYIANDFGHDHLLHNISTPGQIRFEEASGQRGPATAKSFVLGKGSFKGMGVDFADLNGTGKFDIAVSNITTKWGLQESNFIFINQAKDNAEMKDKLSRGIAPFKQEAAKYGMAWTGWCWDVKMGDFLNNGDLSVLQATGFVKGDIDRWPWLQEMAMTNDDLLSNPAMWPNVGPGDDVAGDQHMAFYAKNSDGKYVDISSQIGTDVPIPTRALALADTTGTGVLDFAIARQWGPPAFYANLSPNKGNFINLHLYRPAADKSAAAGTGLANIGAPAYNTTVTVTTPNGKRISQLDGGSGHAGGRSFEVHFGLGDYDGPADVELQWRDGNGQLHKQTLTVTPGVHSLVLTDTVQEVSSR
ncbi:MAG TPA: CRTAC1 family protein [Jatrophihabitans sp.]|uniref:CRTAC1 family protein n=1 Tax=Jatrophihabitans sp. TaxID=1932789 RepID=UPI002F03BBE5